MKKEEHKEAYFQQKILQYIRKEYPSAFVWKSQAGPYMQRGIPDVLAIIDGNFFALEVKCPGGKPSKLQERAIKAINDAGGHAGIVTYLEDVQAILGPVCKREGAK